MLLLVYALRITESNAGVRNGICKYQTQEMFNIAVENASVTLNLGDGLFV
jgi:hypothetical protein